MDINIQLSFLLTFYNFINTLHNIVLERMSLVTKIMTNDWKGHIDSFFL